MKYFRIFARTHSRAYTRIGVLGSALLVMLWIGISASSPGGGVTAAPELATARPPVQAPIVVTATAQSGSPARAAAPSESAADALPDFCVPDAYEPDDNYDQAKPLTMNGVAQIHGFHFAGDKDYYVVNGLVVGQWYDATTSHLVNEADTYMVLRDENYTFLKESDDVGPACQAQPAQPQDCASSIHWRATYPGPYYISVRTLGYPAGASPSLCPGYDMTGRTLRYYLPLVVKDPTPTTPRRHKHIHAHALGDGYTVSDTDRDGYAHRDVDAHCDEHAFAERHADKYPHTDADCYGDAFANTDCNVHAAAGRHRRAWFQLSQRRGHQSDDPSGLRLRSR